MNKRFLMGNEAIGIGAIHAGVHLVTGYPGTPSTEILETVARENDGSIYVEWSVNEKAALEIAAGASYAGARTMVTMKQVGLNVAADPLMSLAYVGVKGGMVVVAADDPGPISSQTEQDTRHFAQFAKLPVFDPSSPEEAYLMIRDAFEYSEQYHTPVIFRPVTRINHSCASVALEKPIPQRKIEGFIKDSSKWVIFPRLSYQNHILLEERNEALKEVLSSYRFNGLEPAKNMTGNPDRMRIGIATGGASYAYVKEVLSTYGEDIPPVLKVATAHPFPEPLALKFMKELDKVIVLEELDPVIERELVYLCGKHHLPVEIYGKLTGDVKNAGENSVESVGISLAKIFGRVMPKTELYSLPELPVRPPVLCAGCPHRASFYAVKTAMKGKKAVFSGDIGCYTLGNAKPLDMVDTCLCMGADVTVAQGLHRVEPDAINFSFIGDSTFFASGITGIVNAVYNETDIVLIILDNATTAMTGHQPHPGTGKTMMGAIVDKISIEKTLLAIGVKSVVTVDPLDQKASVMAVKKASENTGVHAIIFKAPCIAVTSASPLYTVQEDTCIGCMKCIRELGCPAMHMDNKKSVIEPSLCFGCSLCAQVCPVDAIKGGEK